MSNSREQIDPLNMTEEESRYLGSLLVYLNQKTNLYYFPQGSYDYDLDDEVSISLNLKYPILARWSEHNEHELRFEVIGERLGKGGFGGVFHVLLTLIPQTDGSLAKKHVSRMVKEQDNVRYKSTNKQVISDHEYVQGSQTQHLHLKHPVEDEFDEKVRNYLVGRLLQGMNLAEFLKQHGRSQQFTLEDRLRLAVELIRALREQVHALHMVHRDVKAQNIIVNAAPGMMPEVYFIDYGISKRADKVEEGSLCGTRSTMAPEAWRKQNLTVSSDIYSLGVVLSCLFNAALPKTPSYEVAVNRLFMGLFSNIDELSQAQKDRIRNTLNSMCANEAEQRISLENVEAIFEQLRFEVSQAKIHKSLRSEYAAAHDEALLLRNEMRDYWLVDAAKWDVNIVRCEIETRLLGLRNDATLIREFVNTLGVRALDGLNDKDSINDKLRKITADFVFERDDARLALTMLKKMMRRGELANLDLAYIEYLDKLVQKCHRRSMLTPNSIDHALELSRKFAKDVARLKIEIEFIQQAKIVPPAPIVRPAPHARPRSLKDLSRLFSGQKQQKPDIAPHPSSAFVPYQKN